MIAHDGTRYFVLGHPLLVDRHDTLDLRRGYHEPLETALLRCIVEPGDVVVDGGANLGYYSVLLAELVGASGHVHAYEPEPGAFALLEANLAANRCTNVTARRAALGAVGGVGRLWVNPGSNQGDHRTYDPGQERPVVEIEVVALDDATETVFASRAPRVVKLDLQGSEPEVVAGMGRLLDDGGPLVIVSELWPMGLARHLGGAAAYLERLGGAGLELVELDERSGIAARTTADALLARYDPGVDEFTTIVASRGVEVPLDDVMAERARIIASARPSGEPHPPG